jgi:hypothetical protein
MASTPAPVLPDYGDACLTNVVAALLGRCTNDWVPDVVRAARQIALLVLDGLGWEQLRARPHLAPTLTAMAGGAITSVAPTTTATALTSITTGLPPAGHGIVGYRIRAGPAEVLNVLRWRTAAGDARVEHVPEVYQSAPIFGGTLPPVVTRADFASTGFTRAHLPGARLDGWSSASSLAVNVGRHLRAGEPFVYAYYDGIDKVAHERGFGEHYDAELRAADRIVADVAAALPSGAALVVTSDHGQVEVGDAVYPLGPDILAHASLVSGEGRFRWLHARPGELELLRSRADAAFGDVAWVHTVDELEAAGWFGGPLSQAGRDRLGDVALVPHQPIAFADPADTGEVSLRCRHGSLTSAEMYVPLLAVSA